MNIKLNQKIIKETCGIISYKSGNAFYRAKKVTFKKYNSEICEASVFGKDTFHVVIETDKNRGFHSSCSCPTLASYSRDCQHIAAVLLAIYDHQQNDALPNHSSSYHSEVSHQEVTRNLLSLFQERSTRTSVQQYHFENRQVFDPLLTCKLIQVDNEQFKFGIKMKFDSAQVTNVSEFLTQLKEGTPAIISSTFSFDLNNHCFSPEMDAVIQQLIHVVSDGKVSTVGTTYRSTKLIDNDLLILHPSNWEIILPLLIKLNKVNLEYNGQIHQRFQLKEEPLPLQFDLIKTKDKGYQLKVSRLEHLIVLPSYQSALIDNVLTKLSSHDCIRLGELKRMQAVTGTNSIPIGEDQLPFFMEKVVPGLQSLGKVNIFGGIHEKQMKTPLIAKLYLDRIRNRLLAGLEFHYENSVINPLENQNPKFHSMIIRDIDKEEEILQLMEDSLFTRTESGYYLQNEDLEYDFLTYVVPKLRKLTEVYTTTAVKNRIVKDNTFPKIRIKMKKERTNWLEFKFELDGIPKDQIRELLQALEEKRKYYRLRNGTLLSLEKKEFQQVNSLLQGISGQHGTLENGLDVPIEQNLQLLDIIEPTEIYLFEDSFRNFLDAVQNPEREEYEVPAELAQILKNYQIRGYRWMKTLASYGFGGILADDMGLGKTIQSITFILSELSTIREKKLPVLIICPSSVAYNWLSELMKFAPDVEACVIDGTKKERVELQKELVGIDVLITSYPLLRRDVQWYEKQAFHTVFFDEAQVFKNPITQTARAVKKIQANHRFALTGTPVENSLEDLWSIMHVVFPNLFLSLKAYSKLSKQNIARRVRPFLLRRLKVDVLDELPDKQESIELIELLPEQKKLYAAYLAKLRHDTLKHLDKETFRKNKIRILAGLTRLRQICCHPSLFVNDYKGTSQKFEQLMKMVEEARSSGRSILIFSQFTKMLDLIGRELTNKEQPFFYLDGHTPLEERVEICNRFNNGERNLFLISMKAGGTGLNLTGADTVILYDSWWNPAVEEQATDRAYRIGQTNDVQVIKLISRGTIEEKMNELQDKKRHLIEEIIDSDDKVASTLTEADIREILMINMQ